MQAQPRTRRTVIGNHEAGHQMMQARVHSRMRYGPTVMGCTTTEWQRLRRTQGLALDGGRRKRCLTTLIDLVLGHDRDAAVVQVQSQVRMWFTVWQAAPLLHGKIHKAWHKIVEATQTTTPCTEMATGHWSYLWHGLCVAAIGMDHEGSHGLELSAGQPVDSR